MLDGLLLGAEQLFAVQPLLWLVIGSVLGVWLGGVPGLGPIIIMALAVPFTFAMDPLSSLLLLASLHAGGAYGGAISSILLNVPGEASSAATAFDGYPMAQQGHAETALGLSLGSSLVGHIVGLAFLVSLSPFIVSFALEFGPPEYFCLALLGLSVVAFAAQGSTRKGLIMGCFGICIGFIGIDTVRGSPRYTMGSLYLQDGLPWVAIIIGFFAIAEIVKLSYATGTISTSGRLGGSVWRGIAMTFQYPKTLITSTLLGVGIGGMPGVGATTANFLAYATAIRISKTPERFGKGAPEGVIAPEAANNSCVAAALIPTLTLGIPAGAGTAVLLTAVIIQGIQPGPSLFQNQPALIYAFFLGILLSAAIFFVLMSFMVRFIARITIVRSEILVPVLLIVSFVGTYALNSSMGTVIVAAVFGIIGYVLREKNFPVVCFIVGLVLGPMAETSFHQSMSMSGNNYLMFFSRPICIVLLLASAVMIGWQPLSSLARRLCRRGAEPVRG